MQDVRFDKGMPAGWKALFAYFRMLPRARRYDFWIDILAKQTIVEPGVSINVQER